MLASQMTKFLHEALNLNEPVLLVGPPGVGKTDIVREVAQGAGYDMLVSYTGSEDPTEPGGFLWPAEDRSHASKILIGAAYKAVQSKRPLLWFLDEFGQGSPATQAAYMPWLLAREVNGHKLPDHVRFMLATNRRSDRAASNPIIEPVKGRVTIANLDVDAKEWLEWARKAQLDPMIMAFINHRPDLLCAFDPTSDVVNSPMPRNWERASALYQTPLDDHTKRLAVAGRVGEGAAGELFAFVSLYQASVTADEVLKNPKKAGIPTELHLLYALCVALAANANVKNFDKVVQYAERLRNEGHEEFAVLLLKHALERDEALWKTEEFNRVHDAWLSDLCCVR